MIGSLITPSSAKAHTAAVAEHDKTARSGERTAVRGDAASKALTFHSFLEEKKGILPSRTPNSASSSEDTAAGEEPPLENDDEFSTAPGEAESVVVQADDVTAVHDEKGKLIPIDRHESEFSELVTEDTSEPNVEPSVSDQIAGPSVKDSLRRERADGIKTSGLTLMGRTAHKLSSSEALSQQPGAVSANATMPVGIPADTASAFADQSMPPAVTGEDKTARRGEVEGRPATAAADGSKLSEVSEPWRLTLPTSSAGGDLRPAKDLAGQPSDEVVTRSPVLHGHTATPSEEVIPRSGQPSAVNGNFGRLQAWSRTNASAAGGFPISGAPDSVASADVLLDDVMSAVLETGEDANLALERATQRTVSEARTALTIHHHGATTARSVAAQISEAMTKAAERSIDVILNPAELGRVRITLSPSDAGMVVNVAAERAETLDMMRRHSDILGQEFTDLGYGGTDFTFARDDGAGDGGRSQESGEAAPDVSPAPGHSTTIVLRAAPADRLDIRL